MVAPQKVWVEAESAQGGAVLSLRDVRQRRALQEKYGRHNVTMPIGELETMGFPEQYIADLKHGRPVQFKMNHSAYEGMVAEGSRWGESFEGLDGDLVSGPPSWGRGAVSEEEDELVFYARSPHGVFELKAFAKVAPGGRYFTVEQFHNGKRWHERSSGGTDAKSLKSTIRRYIREAKKNRRIDYVIETDRIEEVGDLDGLSGGLEGGAPYRWVITKDYIGGEDKGTEGPHDADSSLKTNREHFVMKDDDGETYYEGDIYGDYDGFEPLHDFGMPNAGATSIWYGGKML